MTGTPDQANYTGAYFIGSQLLADNLAGVVSAVTIISRTIATLPPLIYQTPEKGRVDVEDHSVKRLLARTDGEAGILSWRNLSVWWVSAMLAGTICAPSKIVRHTVAGGTALPSSLMLPPSGSRD